MGTLIPARRPPLGLGLVAALAAVTGTTLLLYALRQVAPAISLGVVYLVAVLGVSVVWGAGLGALTALLAAAAFDVFHIDPVGALSVGRGEDVVALAVFLVAAMVAGTLAEAVRAQAREADEGSREADLAAELARVLLGADELDAARPRAAAAIAAALDLDRVELVAHDAAPPASATALEVPEQGGTLTVPADVPAAVRLRLERGVLPTLGALLRVAGTRQGLLDEAVETRALRRSEELKTTLLRTVSHDLRTPLTAMAASAEALGSPSLSPAERSELAAGAAGQARSLAALVDDLLDLSRLEAGRAGPRRTLLAIDEVLDAAVDDLPPGAVELQLRSDLPMVLADPTQLERAFHNLLDNALRHAGGHPVRVRAAAVGPRLVVRVTDRGPGVPEAERERIFEPFHRGGGPGAGSGLGLAIVRGFVDANGGTVHVEGYPGQGASFVVQLPLAGVPA